MADKQYFMYFELGDDSRDGHGISEKFHLVSNHSVKDINDAIEKFKSESGLDISSWAEDYQDSSLPSEDVNKLVKLGIIKSKENLPGIESWDDENCDDVQYHFDGDDGYISFIFNSIVKHYIPDFTWSNYSIPNEERLDCMDGNGYGLYSL